MTVPAGLPANSHFSYPTHTYSTTFESRNHHTSPTPRSCHRTPHDRAVNAARHTFTEVPGRTYPPGTGPHPDQDRRRHRGSRPADRRARDVRHRPARRPGTRPGGAGRGELPVLRRPARHPARGRVHHPGPPVRLRDPPAGQGRRADHPVEHPVHAGELEARARAGRWLRRRLTAEWTPLSATSTVLTGRPARRRVNRSTASARWRARRCRAPGRAPPLVHGLDQHRPHDHGRRRAAPQGPVHGTGRQVAVRHLRRRRPRRRNRRALSACFP